MGSRCPSLWWKLVFLHLAVLSCSLSYGLFSPDFHFGDGVTEPPSDDTVHELKEGERLQMSCTLTNSALQKTCNASHMAIRLYRNKHYYTLGSQLPRGEFTLAMVIDKASVNESGPYYCYCHDTSLTAVKVTYSIQAPPEEPTDLCIISENQENLTVYFNPVRNSQSLNVHTTWWLFLSLDLDTESAICRESADLEYMCEYQGLGDFGRVPTDVKIYAENKVGNNSKTLSDHHLFNHVKPAPVTVKVKVNDSSQVLLTWRKPNLNTSVFGGLLYEMNFTSDLYPPYQVNVTCESWNGTTESGCAQLEKVVTGLNPYTLYNLGFRSRPVRGGFWSDTTVTAFTTLEDVPCAAPGLLPWMFSLVRDSTGNPRTVIYPQELRQQDKAGVITGYELEYGAWGQMELGSPHSVLLQHSPDPSAALTVRVWAHTSVGRSLNASSITLPPGKEGVRAPGWLDVEKVNRSHFHLFWESQTLEPSALLQVHWCWGQAERFRQATLVTCKTDIGTRRVPSTSTSAVLDAVTDYGCPEPANCSLHFGLSVDSAGTSSGIVWNTCVFEYGEVAEKVPDLQILEYPDTLLVSWSYPCHLTEDYRHGRPVTFESRHFPYSGNQSSARDCEELQGLGENSTALHGENRREVPGLQAGAGYLFCVRSLTLSSTGPWRDRVQRLALHPNADSSKTLAIVVGLSAAAFFIIACVSIIFAIRHRLQQKLEIRTEIFAEKPRDTYQRKSFPLSADSEHLPHLESNGDAVCCPSEVVCAPQIAAESCSVENQDEVAIITSTFSNHITSSGESNGASSATEEDDRYRLAMQDEGGSGSGRLTITTVSHSPELEEEDLDHVSSSPSVSLIPPPDHFSDLSQVNFSFVDDGTTEKAQEKTVPGKETKPSASTSPDPDPLSVERRTRVRRLSDPRGMRTKVPWDGMAASGTVSSNLDGEESPVLPCSQGRNHSSGSLTGLNGLEDGYARLAILSRSDLTAWNFPAKELKLQDKVKADGNHGNSVADPHSVLTMETVF